MGGVHWTGMLLRKLLSLLVFCVVGTSVAAHAQLAAYGTVSVEHVTGLTCLNPPCGNNSGTVSPVGGGGGIFYDWRTVGRFRVGFDARASSTITNKNAVQYGGSPSPRIFSVLGGVRASTRIPVLSMKPYAQGSVGWDRTNVAGHQFDANGKEIFSSGLEFRGFVGVDLPVFPVMDFRVVELGAGSVHASGSTFPIYSISTGLVFHLPIDR